MKVVKNARYGGFGLSPMALGRIAELMGKQLYFFKHGPYSEPERYTPISCEEAAADWLWTCCYTVPNPGEYRLLERDEDGLFKSANERAVSISLPDFRDYSQRSNPLLVQTVEELGTEANGRFANLVVVEIPDGIEYEFDDYDGFETIHEKHRSW